jgi:hypothetical protein
VREHIAGRTPRLTAYLGGLSFGLGLVVAGAEGARHALMGALSPTAALGYAALGAACGVAAAFVVGYLNGSLLASWGGGFVPAAGLMGRPVAGGTLAEVAAAFADAVGVGVLLGAVGFALAVEKHRRDARTADLPAPPARRDLVVLVVGSAVLGGGLAAVPMAV